MLVNLGFCGWVFHGVNVYFTIKFEDLCGWVILGLVCLGFWILDSRHFEGEQMN